MVIYGIVLRVVVLGKCFLNFFCIFLYCVFFEILEEDLKFLKFILVDEILEGILENC